MKKQLLMQKSTHFYMKLMFLLWCITSLKTYGQQGAALHFDGVDDMVECGNFLPLSYTKEAWVNLENLSLQNNFISGGADGQHAFWAPNTNGGKLAAGHNGYWYSVSDDVPLEPNVWYHVAVTYDATTTTMRLYKNGVLVDENTAVDPVSGGNFIRLGSYNYASNLFQGKMDEVRIWNRVLEPCELLNNRDYELAQGQAGLVAYYTCNQGQSNASNQGVDYLTDTSVNNNEAYLINFELEGQTSNWIVPGSPANGNAGTLYVPMTVATSQSLCNANQVADLIVSGSGDIRWYDVPNGGYALANSDTITTGTYYVEQVTAFCVSQRTAVAVTVNESPAPSANALQVFDTNATIANLSASGTDLLWYAVPTGGNSIPATTVLSTGTYYVEQTNNGCISPRTAVQVVVNAGSLNLGSTTDKINLGTAINAQIDPINTFTVEAWVYPTTMQNGLGNDYGMIIGNYNTVFVDMQFMLRKEGANYAFWVNDSATTNFKNVTAYNTVVLNQWQHIAGVWDGSSIKIYINGVLIATTNGVNGTSFKNVPYNNIVIGENLSNEKFIGNVDEIRLWSRALTQEEMSNNLNCELVNPQTGLLAYYKCNQGEGNGNNSGLGVLNDSSGNNYNGNLVNFNLNGASSNWSSISAVQNGLSCSPFLSNPVFASTTVQVFPNPTDGVIHLTSEYPIKEITVTTMLGQKINGIPVDTTTGTIDLSTLSSGLYLIECTTTRQKEQCKIFKK